MKYTSWEVSPAGTLEELPPLVGRIMAARGFTADGAREFLRTDAGLLHDPMDMRNMDKAVARIQRALDSGERFAIYGDYDVDGMTATCLLYDFFAGRGGNVRRYIPHRLREGYGLNRAALAALREDGCTLVVTVDCGITAVEEVAWAREQGMDVVITDHHSCKETLPDAVAVVDPQLPDCTYPFKGLAGVGVALKLAMAMGARLEEYSHLVALGTVADVMPLVDENRAIVAMGLTKVPHHPGLRALMEEAGVDPEDVNSTNLSFTICPRLNAAGRLGQTQAAEALLLSQNAAQAQEHARLLCELNRERQRLEGDIFQRCREEWEAGPGTEAAIVLAGEGWHQGVVGIVASRLAERYQRPAFIISLEDGMGKGSCRSALGVSLFRALEGCADVLEGYGGHDMAAGFTVREENIPLLRERLSQWVVEHRQRETASALKVDCVVDDVTLLSQEDVDSLRELEPFGAGNPKPVLGVTAAVATALNRVGDGGKHLRLTLEKDGWPLSAIFFSFPQEEDDFMLEDQVDLAFTPQVSHFRGRNYVQLITCDLRHTVSDAGRIYEKFCRGEPLEPGEARQLIPSRAEFEGIWRQLRSRAPLADMPRRLARRVAESLPTGDAARVLLSLQVFAERGLIELEHTTARLQISLTDHPGKVDLESSPILRSLRSAAGA